MTGSHHCTESPPLLSPILSLLVLFVARSYMRVRCVRVCELSWPLTVTHTYFCYRGLRLHRAGEDHSVTVCILFLWVARELMAMASASCQSLSLWPKVTELAINNCYTLIVCCPSIVIVSKLLLSLNSYCPYMAGVFRSWWW